MFSEKELNLEETDLREQIALLSEQERALYETLETNAFKQPGTYALLNALFFVGAHHFYLQRWLRGLLSIVLGLIAVFLLLGTALVYGAILLLAMAIIEIPQLLNYRHLVHAYNNNAMRRCLREARKSLR